MMGRLRLVALLAAAVGLLFWTQPQLWDRLRSAFGQVRPAVVAASAVPTANKCVAPNGALLYSTEPCPVGTQTRVLSGGTVSTVDATPLPKAPASAVLRQLNDPHEAAELREKRLQQVIDP